MYTTLLLILALKIADLVTVLYVIRSNGLAHADWEELGLQLGLLLPTLKTIKKDKGDAGPCMMGCIAAWLELRDNVMNIGIPSWYTLVKAIGNIDASIAMRIKQGNDPRHTYMIIQSLVL